MSADHRCVHMASGECTEPKGKPVPRLHVDGAWYCPKHAPKTCDRNCSHPDRRWDGACSWCGAK